MYVCEWVNVTVVKRYEWSKKTRKALYKYSPFMINYDAMLNKSGLQRRRLIISDWY